MPSVTEKLLVADITIEMLAAENLELKEHNSSLTADNKTYRELAVAGFDALHMNERTSSRLRAELERERIENARLRETILERAAA